MAAIFSKLFGRFGAFTTEIVLFEPILYNVINDSVLLIQRTCLSST